MAAASTITRKFEVLIIGGGPAGYASALALSRQRHTAALFDSGVYRNRFTTHMHNVPTWDHQDTAEYRNACRKELLTRYKTTTFVEANVLEVKKDAEGGFVAKDNKGDLWEGKKLILATGVSDVMIDDEIPGYSEAWGKGIFHCLYCHGYDETGDHSVGVLAVGMLASKEHALKRAIQGARFGTKAIVYTNGNTELADSLASTIPQGKSIEIDNRPIQRVQKDAQGSAVTVILEDGGKVQHGFLTHVPFAKPNIDFASSLGLELSQSKMEVAVKNPFNETNVPGCFVAGDACVPAKAVIASVNAGLFAAVGAGDQLQSEV